MRALQCVCEEQLLADTDEGLFELARQHADREHPELRLGEERLRDMVVHLAYAER